MAVHNLSKTFGHVRALQDVSFDLWPGEVVGLVGDNGAGKSTLVSLVAGAQAPTSGHMFLKGEEFAGGHPALARERGIEVVYQDLALSMDLDVACNIFIGREMTSRNWLARKVGWLDYGGMRRHADRVVHDLGVKIPDRRRVVRDFSGGQRQGVAVARAVSWASTVLVLDEPTAALGVEQQHSVAEMVKSSAGKDIAVLLVSHNLPQVVDLCDRVLVLLRGRLIATLAGEGISADSLLRWITGAGA